MSRRQQALLATLIVAITVLLAAGGGAWYFHAKSTRTTLNKETLCPEQGPAEITVVLVDRTDPFGTVQRAAIRTHLEDIRAEIPRHGSIELYSVGEIGPTLLRPEVKICNPGRGADVSAIDNNPRRLERRWQERFANRLDAVFDQMTEPNQGKTSPVLESIQSIAVTAFAGRARQDVPKKLVIVSDMLQHTPGHSQYSAVASYDAFRKSEYFRSVRADLRGIDVEILYVRRGTARSVQGQAHIKFWQAYLTDMGARLGRVVSVEG
jgi:hypothetical protein